MKKKSEKADQSNSMEELQKFLSKKKDEQEALRKLLKALDKQSFEENKNITEV